MSTLSFVVERKLLDETEKGKDRMFDYPSKFQFTPEFHTDVQVTDSSDVEEDDDDDDDDRAINERILE